MYAIVEIAGKQYKVKPGLKFHVDKLDVEEGSTVSLDKVLLVKTDSDLKIGMPYVEGVSFSASVKTALVKDKKVIVFHYKNKTGFHKKQGHRHQYTLLSVGDMTSEKPVEALKAIDPEKNKPVKIVKKTEKLVKVSEKVKAKPASKPAVKKAPKK